jgi:hypothetical protein
MADRQRLPECEILHVDKGYDADAIRRCSSSAAPAVQSATWPPVSMKARGRHRVPVSAWIFVVRPLRDRPMA